ncbi:cohesin domain-containing protein, partial [Phaeodactylibacter luteus]
MNKLFTCLILGLFVCGVSLSAQTPTFSIDPTTTDAAINDVIEVDIRVSDFQGLASAQFGVRWDPAVLRFVSIKNINSAQFPGLIESVFSTPNQDQGGNVPPGGVGVAWFESSFTTVSVPDGTLFYTLELRVLDCGPSDITFGGPPTPGIEVLNGSFVNVGLNPENGVVNVTNPECAGGADPEVSLDIRNTTLGVGEQGCIDVRVQDFTDIASMQLSISYDPSVVSYNGADGFNLPGLDFTDFANPSAGVITVDWSSGAGATLPDNATAFQLCFTGEAAGTSSVEFADTPLPISVENTSNENVIFNGNNGMVTVEDVSVTLDILNNVADLGNEACVEVRALDFEDIGSMQFTINYDDSRLSLNGVDNFNLTGLDAGDFDTSVPGVITCNWSAAGGATVPNGTSIFRLCFTTLQEGTTSLSFSDTPVATQAATSGGAAIELNGQNGNITVNAIDVIFDLSDEVIQQGETACVDVTVADFNNIAGIQLSIAYDASLLEFDNITLQALPGLQQSDFNTSNAGVVTLNWSSANSVTLPDGAVLFQLCFTGTGVGNAGLTFSDVPLPIEILTSGGAEIDFSGQSGAVEIQGIVGTGDLT